MFESLGQGLRIVIVGASGGIGTALVDHLVASPQVARVHALSRQGKSHPSPKASPKLVLWMLLSSQRACFKETELRLKKTYARFPLKALKKAS